MHGIANVGNVYNFGLTVLPFITTDESVNIPADSKEKTAAKFILNSVIKALTKSL